MKYRLIAMDLDGTLNNDQKTVDQKTLRALTDAQEAGIRLALASARPLPGLYRERDLLDLKRHHGLLMAYNGGVIVDASDGRVLSSTPMALEDAKNVLRLLETMPVTPILDDGERFYVTDPEGYKVAYECQNNRMRCEQVDNLARFIRFAPWKILMSVQPEEIKMVQATIAAALPDWLSVVQTAPFYLEVIPSRVNKGLGLEAACRAAGIPLSEAVAFGDSENDIPMLIAAGVGVAMGNADEAVKAAADRVTLTNNEDGIAAALEILLSE